ncbi:MAG: DNA adenine methylase [Myxococcales bacterium]|nr:DNA adenine methylase [Myxococcales bacterium]MCB9579410.1 DNA adenine methylase [Polyangiaceae bacterium]
MTRRATRPVLKWAGGKTQLLERILPLLPESIETYYEPFVGGGAVFFALATQQRFRRAVISDRNADLLSVYRALQADAEAVISELKRMRHSEEEYYRVRAARPRTLVKRAARVIYLNKTGYNGLYRVNRSGGFNVPFGRYKNPNICDEPNLRAAASALQGVEILEADFETVCKKAKPGDAVYFDPPYLPLSITSNFSAYHSLPFGLEEHARLARVFGALADRGVGAVLSNSSTPESKKIFAGFKGTVVPVSRPINSKANGRGHIDELLLVNQPGRLRRV